MTLTPLTKTLRVRTAFRFAGQSFKPGDVFPWHRLSCSTRKVSQLLNAGYLRVPTENDIRAEVLAPSDTPPADTPPADTPPADTPPADTPPAVVYDPSAHTIVKVDKNVSHVVAKDGSVVAKIKAAAAATLKKAEHAVEIVADMLV